MSSGGAINFWPDIAALVCVLLAFILSSVAAVVGYLIKTKLNEMSDDIHDLQDDVGNLKTSVALLNHAEIPPTRRAR